MVRNQLPAQVVNQQREEQSSVAEGDYEERGEPINSRGDGKKKPSDASGALTGCNKNARTDGTSEENASRGRPCE